MSILGSVLSFPMEQMCVMMRLSMSHKSNDAVHVNELRQILDSCTKTPDAMVNALINNGILLPVNGSPEYFIYHEPSSPLNVKPPMKRQDTNKKDDHDEEKK